jgi:sortase A
MKKHGSTIFLVVILLIGLSLLLYPTFSDWWNSFTQTQAIVSYSQEVVQMDNDQYREIWEKAWAFNRRLLERENIYALPEDMKDDYTSLLDISGSGIMGYIEIPEVKVTLPIYHGIEENVLQVAVGHLDWTSLPVGGESSHCVLSGHRGLPSARLFTDLDKVIEGDLFLLRVLDEVLTYEVDQIRIVLPHEVEDLTITEGADYCTLVTCTPYGVNSHRLLVRGTRTDLPEQATAQPGSAQEKNNSTIILFLCMGFASAICCVWFLLAHRKRHKYEKQ